MNAGCTPDLERIRVLTHAGGRVLSEHWVDIAPERLGTPSGIPVPVAA
jgi:hypothetical protein